MKGAKFLKSGPSISLTGGRFSRAQILTPASGTHPMGARERLALFNMLDCHGQTVLDLFAGSGALGLEALSRGAKFACFVEKSPAACRIIKANIAKLGLSEVTRVITANIATTNGMREEACGLAKADGGHEAIRGLAEANDMREEACGLASLRASRDAEARDGGPEAEQAASRSRISLASLVLADPPYDHPAYFTPQSITIYANFVKSGGTLVLSRPKNAEISAPESLKLLKTRQYAGLAIDFFTKL